MRYALLFVLLASLDAIAADNWWTPTDYTMPELLSMGYEVVGFSTFDVGMGRSSEKIRFRYVLQKNESVIRCDETESVLSGAINYSACKVSLNAPVQRD